MPFLHYSDLGPYFLSLKHYVKQIRQQKKAFSLDQAVPKQIIDKHGKMSQVLSHNDLILVQIEKMPLSKKGPRVSSALSLAGRYLVITPFNDEISISKRIAGAHERRRLERLVHAIKPKHFGVIIRTAAEKIPAEKLVRDLKKLSEAWEESINRIATVREKERILGSSTRANLLLRDLLDDTFDNIYADTQPVYDQIHDYIKEIAPDKVNLLKRYESRKKIFEQFNIERQLKVLFMRQVLLPSGGSLIIEHTEALHVIDVNSGKSTEQVDQESNALRTNLDACKEIARQIRLRDLGGIIVIDFIDMNKRENKDLILKTMKDAMANDRSKFTLLPLTKFGLMQMTRHRVRPTIQIETSEQCPTCAGTGKVESVLGISEIIEKTSPLPLSKEKN